MPHVVTGVRDAVRAALVVALPGVSWETNHWVKVDTPKLPRGYVATPRVQTNRMDYEGVSRTVDVVVVIKREGGANLESELDDLSAVVEPAVLMALASLAGDYELAETQTAMDGVARKSVGELSMLFRVILWTDEGDPD